MNNTAKTITLKWFAVADRLEAETGIQIPIDIIDSTGVMLSFFENNEIEEWSASDYDVFISETSYASNSTIDVCHLRYMLTNKDIKVIEECIKSLRIIYMRARNTETLYFQQFKFTSMENIISDLTDLIR